MAAVKSWKELIKFLQTEHSIAKVRAEKGTICDRICRCNEDSYGLY